MFLRTPGSSPVFVPYLALSLYFRFLSKANHDFQDNNTHICVRNWPPGAEMIYMESISRHGDPIMIL